MRIIALGILIVISVLAILFGLYVIGIAIHDSIYTNIKWDIILALIVGGLAVIGTYVWVLQLSLKFIKGIKSEKI